MLGLDQRALKIVWTVFLFALVVATVYGIRNTLVTFTLALFLAHLLAPVVALVDRVTPAHVPRTAALGIVYVALIAAVIAILIPLSSNLTEQAANLVKRLPQLLSVDPLARVTVPASLEPARDRLVREFEGWMNQVAGNLGPVLTKATGQVINGIEIVINLVLIPILAFFFIKDGGALRRDILTSLPEQQRPIAANIFSDLHVLLAQYIRALVVLSMAAFVFYVGFLAIIGAPFAILLAGFAAVLEFIPAVGPFVGAATIVIVTAASGYSHWLLIIIFLAVYRIFQDYILNPALMSSGVQIHPLLVLFGVLAGAEIAGVRGIFFSVPVIAALRLIIVRLRRRTRVS